jgi:colicin import membrane protein
MAEQKESSVLFSLKELMNLEEDRIRQEEDQKRRVEEEQARVRAEAERRAREEEEARLRAIEEKRRTEEQRGREENAKLEAIRHAEVEKARLEAENRARMEQMSRQQEHERQLAMVTQDKSKKRLVFIASGIGLLLVAGLVGGAVFYSNAQKQKQALEAQLQDLQAKQEENNRKMNELNDKLSHATSPEERAQLESQIEEAKKKQADLAAQQNSVKPGGATGGHYTGGGTGAAPKPNLPKCKPCAGTGDPLCPDIPGQTCTM